MPLAPIASHGSAEDLSEDQYFMEPDEVNENLWKFVYLYLIFKKFIRNSKLFTLQIVHLNSYLDFDFKYLLFQSTWHTIKK